MIEMLVAMALAGLASTLLLAGARPLTAALALESARLTLIDALLEARRSAYMREASAAVRAPVAAGSLELLPGGARRELPGGVAVVSGPADSGIEFRATGLADNATVTLASGDATAAVVVNQRGVIR